MTSQDENFCSDCYKQYPNQAKYQTHMKLKHREGKNQQKDILNEDSMHDIEDKIYFYFGELSQAYADIFRPPEQQNLDEHRFIGQANYLTNLAVRTPYQNEINVIESIPPAYQFRPRGEIGLTEEEIQKMVDLIKEELGLLHKKLEEQRNFWQFADPYNPKTNFEEEFSIFDVRKLIKNYPKKNLNLKFPQLTIFLVWVARICKIEMFQLTFSMLISYTICYEAFCKKENLSYSARKNSKSWLKFVETQKQSSKNQIKNQGQNYIRSFSLPVDEKSVSIKKMQKLLELYDSWVTIVMPGLPTNKKTQQESQTQKIAKELPT